jgi:hypothetical protein
MFNQQRITFKIGTEIIPNISFFYMSKDIMDTLGVARCEFPYNASIKEKLKVGTVDISIEGGIDKGRIFHGIITEQTRQGDKLSVSLIDYGIYFKKECQTSYADERLEDVVKKILKEIKFTPIIKNVSPQILDKKITKSTITETISNTADSIVSSASSGVGNLLGNLSNAVSAVMGGDNVCFTGKPSCSYRCGSYTTVTKCYKNYCPLCHKSGTLINKNKAQASAEGEITCSACDADYCINCGRDKAGGGSRGSLTPADGGSPASSGGTTSTVTTYEDVLNKICAENNLYMYLDQEENCIIQEFKGKGASEYKFTPDMIPRDLYTYLNGEVADKSFKVQVNYKNGTIEKIYGDETKITESNTQKYDQKDLDQSKAEEYAQQIINQTLREKNVELGARVIATRMVYPGKWVEIPTIEDFSKTEIMYVCGQTCTVTPGEVINYDLTFKEAPPIPETSSSSMSSTDLRTLEQIRAKGATFHYSHSCSDAGCLESTGQGDCYAMSDWLYEKLTAAGIRSRIIWYSSPSNHRIVQLYQGTSWVDFDYNGYDTLFKAHKTRSGERVYRGG